MDVNAVVGVNCFFFFFFLCVCVSFAAVGSLWRVGSYMPSLDLQQLLFWYVVISTLFTSPCIEWARNFKALDV